MTLPPTLVRVVGPSEDRERPLRLLLGLAVLLSLPTVVFGLVLVVDDLGQRTDEMDGFGIVFGVVLLLWVGIVVLLAWLALRLRERRTASQVLGVLAGLGTFWVSTAALVWVSLPDLVGVPLTWLAVLLGLASAALGVLAALR